MDQTFKKGLIQLAFMMITLVVIVIAFRYFLTPTIDPIQQAQISNAKRLFGDAWKESMKLDNGN